MGPKCLFLLLLLLLRAAHAQKLELSGNAGFGVAERDGYGLPGVPSGGVSIAWPYSSSTRLQFDYALGHIERRSIGSGPGRYNRHFLTGSYIRQTSEGRVRPFIQAGGGIQYETNNLNSQINRSFDSNNFRTTFAGIAGAGFTIPIGRAYLIRPQFRAYISPGRDRTVNVTALPLIGVGWQF